MHRRSASITDGSIWLPTTIPIRKIFYVYTDDIYGEWSDPVFVDQGGIDPSLYFEGDKVYFISNGTDESDGRGCIFQCEIDIATGKRLTGSRPIWKAAADDTSNPRTCIISVIGII